MIELTDLVKKFGSFAAVDGLTLNVPPGEFFGFLGPNGAGKTTTIKMMTGLFTPTAGSVRINGFDIVRQPIEAKGTIGYIPDQPYLYDKLTGREFLFYVAGLHRVPKRISSERIAGLVDRFEVGEWIDKKTEEYSQGMRQRVSIAAALLHEPKTIIIDEPMVGLDPRSARIVKDALLERARSGVAIFMSTHILEIVDELCDRVGIIKDGRLIFLGGRESLHETKARYDGRLESVFLELTK